MSTTLYPHAIDNHRSSAASSLKSVNLDFMPMKIPIEVPSEESPKLVVADIMGLGRFILTNETELTINITKECYYPLKL